MTFFSTLLKIFQVFAAILCSVASCTFVIAFFIIYFVARPICNSTILTMILSGFPILTEIVGIAVAFTGIGIPITGVLLIIGTILEVVGLVCDIVNYDVLAIIFTLLGIIPIAGLPLQIMGFARKLFF